MLILRRMPGETRAPQSNIRIVVGFLLSFTEFLPCARHSAKPFKYSTDIIFTEYAIRDNCYHSHCIGE